MWRSTRLDIVLTIHDVPFLFFVLSYYVSLRSEFRVVVSALGFPHKNDVRFVSTFICVVFCFLLRLVYHMLPVSLDCLFGIL